MKTSLIKGKRIAGARQRRTATQLGSRFDVSAIVLDGGLELWPNVVQCEDGYAVEIHVMQWRIDGTYKRVG